MHAYMYKQLLVVWFCHFVFIMRNLPCFLSQWMNLFNQGNDLDLSLKNVVFAKCQEMVPINSHVVENSL